MGESEAASEDDCGVEDLRYLHLLTVLRATWATQQKRHLDPRTFLTLCSEASPLSELTGNYLEV
jgi:hypothetical protein